MTPLSDRLPDPQFRSLVEEAMREFAEARHELCHFGYCQVDISSTTGKIIGGMGPINCPCDHLPGWKSRHSEGAPRPAVPVKARGRHGSRVQRSRRRHVEPDYMKAFGGFLPAVSRATERASATR